MAGCKNQVTFMDIHSGSSSFPSSLGWEYDVFLNFRGDDIRTSFIDHLYHALTMKGIKTFKDDKELNKGRAIASGLFKAIEESRFAIIIFSENYAPSTWCLDEVVKIVKCKNISEEVVFLIFYKIDPSDVRKQIGNFQKAFDKYEEEFRENIEKVNEWRTALRKVCKLVGWHLKKDRPEAEFIEEIIKEILQRLRVITRKTFDDLVGMDSRVKAFKLLLDSKSDDVRMIGICGMGGLGKTTIARFVYNLVSCQFEGSSFLANVRERSKDKGLITLQKQLLSQLLNLKDINIWDVDDGVNMIKNTLLRKRVLIVIDDVDNLEQLYNLARRSDWFGLGSKIIITARDEHVLRSHGVNAVYKPKELNHDEALQLFCIKAFKTNKPFKEYVWLSECVVRYTGSLPLAIKILGSFFCGRTIDQWESALERLKKEPERRILDILQISYDGLNGLDKKIFLDIACFFKGKDRNYVTKILDGCGFDPDWGINILIEKSLITIVDGSILWMHDLLQVMGQEVVKRQCLEEPGKRSRLWKAEDIHHGSEVVEGIIVKLSEAEMHLGASEKVLVHLNANAKAFSKMTNLRLLKIYNLQPPKCIASISSNLRLLEWHGYSSKYLPSSLQLDKIVELNLPYSSIEQLWKGNKILSNLKLMRLDHSNNLIRTPDLTGFPNLEKIDFDGCMRLRDIHPSLMFHKKLMVLNLTGCTSLAILSNKISLESLKILYLSGCSKLKKFPEIVGKMECLVELSLDGTAIKELPLSLGLLTGLTFLSLKNCINLVRLPSTMNGMKSLYNLSLSGCFKLENLPENLGQLESLKRLNISGIPINQSGPSIFCTENLAEALSFYGRRGSPSSISSSLLFPISLAGRKSPNSMALKLPSLSGLWFLTSLDLSDRNLEDGTILSNICELVSLEELNLSGNNFVWLPESIKHLSSLRKFYLTECKRLQCLPTLPSNVKFVRVDGCASLEKILDGPKLEAIWGMNCWKLHGWDGLAVSMINRWVLDASSTPESTLVVPGSKIPNWFNYQNEGSSITIEKAAYSYNKYELAGYVICFVFHVDKPLPTVGRFQQLDADVSLRRNGDKTSSRDVSFFAFDEPFSEAVSDHLYFVYVPYEEYFDHEHLPYYKDIKLSLEPDNPAVQVKRCGIHPVYVHKWQKFNQTTNEGSCSVVWNLNELHGDYVGSAMDVATTSKQNQPYYVGEHLEASGSSWCHDEEPQPSRFQELE